MTVKTAPWKHIKGNVRRVELPIWMSEGRGFGLDDFVIGLKL